MFKKILITLTIVFFILITGATIYSITVYQYNLPEVQLVLPKPHIFEYNILEDSIIKKSENLKIDMADEDFDNYDHAAIIELPYEDYNMNFFFIKKGDTAVISKIENSRILAEGKIVLVSFDEKIYITLGFNGEDFNENDKVNITINKSSNTFNTVIPESAIVFDPIDKNFFIYLVTQVDGAWGKENILEKKYIDILIKKDGNVAISEDISSPFMVSSDKPIFEGSKVRIFPKN